MAINNFLNNLRKIGKKPLNKYPDSLCSR